jgi:hypothetical protein
MLVRSSPPPSLRAALDRIAEGLELVERSLRDQLSSPQELIGTIGEHVLSSGGKRLRPALLFLSAELCGYTGPRRVQVAAAVELLHTASLLHDDVVDLGEVRRGRPSANAIWGNSRAVLVGDFCLARASGMIVEDGDPDILWIFANTIALMSEGELLQLQNSFDPSVTEARYYEVIERNAKHVDAIAKALKKADALYLATDPDREGEAIAWHLAEELKVNPVEAKRVTFDAITKSEVQRAFEHPRAINGCHINNRPSTGNQWCRGGNDQRRPGLA